MTNETQTKKLLEILVVEDTLENMEVARSYFDQRKDIAVGYVTNYDQAMKKLEDKKYDGVITDLFMPEKEEGNDPFFLRDFYMKLYETIYQDIGRSEYGRYLDRVLNCCYELREEIFSKKGNAPLGILIAEKAKEKEIPYVIATSLFHHNNLAEPAFYYIRHELRGLVEEGAIRDGYEENVKLKPEYWERVLLKIEGMIKQKEENDKR